MQIITHPGIGDVSWIYSKLVNCGEDLDLIIAEDKKTSRALPFVDLLPKVSSAEYGTMGDYIPLSECGNAYFQEYKIAEDLGMDLFVSANNYLEEGNRLEGYLPDLETDFHYPINTSDQDRERARILLPGGVYLGIYTSSQGGADSWSGWGVHEWSDYVSRVRREFPHVMFVIMGAKWDTDLSDALSRSMNSMGVEHINLCGKTPMGVAVECLKRLNYFIGFASGMGILSNVLSKPQVMLYPHHLRDLMHSWPCPVSLANGSHQGVIWDRPITIYRKTHNYMKHYLNDRGSDG
ncbi:MAG: hypothetical protein GWN14_02180 [candidate division Zixibacteria bacterium]|nr:hypothetical protein [Gammaproteobacteria bacterium]NIX54764.1 hypothetical protein [candidate division Zixibacteria bacterium]